MVMPRIARKALSLGLLGVALLLSACGGAADPEGLAAESIFSVEIPGTSSGRITTSPDGTVTKLFDLAGDWEQVSVALARLVQIEGWTIESLNCVGTGNDVIAKKQVEGEWLLLESGAGGRGAGLIVSRAAEQGPLRPFTVTGRCSDALVRAVD